MTDEYKTYLQSDHWQTIRKIVLERDHYHCMLCGSKENLNVHHNCYQRVGCERLDDLITLCEKCHNNFHNGKDIYQNKYPPVVGALDPAVYGPKPKTSNDYKFEEELRELREKHREEIEAVKKQGDYKKRMELMTKFFEEVKEIKKKYYPEAFPQVKIDI